MKSRILIIALSALVLSPSCQVQPTYEVDNALGRKLDSLFLPYIENEEIAGIAIGASIGDSVIINETYGFADLAFKTSLPKDARFQIGSITKQFTAVAILQLAQEGKIQLDDDIRKYVDIKTNNKTVTIDQLLHHTSGIKSHTDLKEFFQINKYDFPRDTLLRLVEENNFEFEPGTNYKYCDMGYQLLGRVIEKVSEKDYYSYMNSEVINKTQLKGTYFWDSEKVKPLEAYGYQKSATGVFEDASYINATGDFVHAPYINFKWPYAAGGLGSTVSDLLRWNQLIHHSEVLLSKKFYDLLVSPYSLLDGELTSYGCGLVIRELGGYKAYFHSGGTPGFRSWLGYYPELDLSIVLLSNTWTNLAFLPISLEMRNIVLEMLVTNDKLNKQTIVPANNRKEN